MSRQIIYYCTLHKKEMRSKECRAIDCMFTEKSFSCCCCKSGGFGIRPASFTVLKLLCQGLSVNEIAEKTICARTTVVTHLSNMYKQQSVDSMHALVSKAFNEGWVQPKCLS
jgi:DNA-binding CsgD family transcriptional regulator